MKAKLKKFRKYDREGGIVVTYVPEISGYSATISMRGQNVASLSLPSTTYEDVVDKALELAGFFCEDTDAAVIVNSGAETEDISDAAVSTETTEADESSAIGVSDEEAAPDEKPAVAEEEFSEEITDAADDMPGSEEVPTEEEPLEEESSPDGADYPTEATPADEPDVSAISDEEDSEETGDTEDETVLDAPAAPEEEAVCETPTSGDADGESLEAAKKTIVSAAPGGKITARIASEVIGHALGDLPITLVRMIGSPSNTKNFSKETLDAARLIISPAKKR